MCWNLEDAHGQGGARQHNKAASASQGDEGGEERAGDGCGDPAALHHIQGNFSQPAHSAGAGGPHQDLRYTPKRKKSLALLRF